MFAQMVKSLLTKSLLVALLAAGMFSGLLGLPNKALAAEGLPELHSPTLPESPHTVKLPGVFEQVVVGGGGRYLIFYLKSQRQLAVFDVNEAKITKYLPVPGDDILYAAGATKLVVVIPAQKIIQRYSLTTFERELTLSLDSTNTIGNLALGSASQGPILLGSDNHGNEGLQFLSLATLKPITIKRDSGRHMEFGSDAIVQASANGQVFSVRRTGGSPTGLAALVLSGKQAKLYYEHDSVGYIAPSPDGRLLYTADGVFTNQTNALTTRKTNSFIRMLPAQRGAYALGIAVSDLPESVRRRMAEEQGIDLPAEGGLTIHIGGESTPLATVSAFDLGSDSEHPIASWRYQRLDQRLFFIPSASTLVYVPETRDQIVLYRVDLDEILSKIERDFIIVESFPSSTAEPQQSYEYAMQVRTNNGPLKYHLESGPAGMKLDDKGKLSWQVPKSASGTTEHVIVSVTNATDHQQFQSFSLTVSGDPQPRSAKEVAAAKTAEQTTELTEPLDLSAIKPSQLAQPHVEYELPAAITDVAWAANGRLLILHFASLRKLGVFDVNQGRIIHYLSANGDNLAFAAGATKLVVASGDQRVLSRYDLATFERELTVPLDISKPIRFATMGHASEGPLMIGASDDRYGANALLYDLKTLQPLDIRRTGGGDVGARMRVSANGRVFGSWQVGLSPSGLNSFILDRNTLTGRNVHTSVGHIRPTADGSVLCTGRGLYTNQCVAYGGESLRNKSTLPAVTGTMFVVPDVDQRARSPQEYSLGIYMLGDARRLFTVTDMPPVNEGIFSRGNTSVDFDKRLHFHPEANLIISIPPTADRLHLMQFDFDKALEESGIDYLIVTSKPPRTVQAGTKLEYELAVKSKKGGLTYKVEAGPEGMKFGSGSKLLWQVPKTLENPVQNVILLVRDSAGQEVFHTFELKVEAAKPKVVQVPARRVDSEPAKEPRRVLPRAAEPRSKQPIAQPTPTRTPRTETRAENPFALPDRQQPVAQSEIRTWTDKTGKHKVEARFLGVSAGNANLLRKDGKQVVVPLSSLSDYDRGYAEALAELKLEFKSE